MSLLIPEVIIRSINPHSGFINSSSEFGGKTVKGLFLLQQNEKFLVQSIYNLLVSKEYVQDVIEIDGTSKQSLTLVESFKPLRPIIAERIRVLIESWQLPHREDHATRNPVQQLAMVNQEFIFTTSRTFIQSPDMLVPNYYDIDPLSGQVDAPEWDYGTASWADGTWHPEHLFTQSKRNRANVYWVPVNVTWDTNPPPGDYNPTAFHPRTQHYNPSRAKSVQGPRRDPQKREQFVQSRDQEAMPPVGRKDLVRAGRVSKDFDTPNITDLLEERSYPYIGKDVFSETYHLEDKKYAPGPGAGNRYRYDFYGDHGFTTGGTIPRWQTSVNDRPIQRNISEGLREGGSGDRRVQRPHGYDMSALTSKSSY